MSNPAPEVAVKRRREAWKNPWVWMILLAAALAMAGGIVWVTQYQRSRKHWTLWQLPPVGKQQAMSYVLRTSRGRLIVVDGGWVADGPVLEKFIQDHGGDVAAWFLTHPHPDHIGAITSILNSPLCPRIEAIYASLPTEDFVRVHEPQFFIDLLKLKSAVKDAGMQVHDVKLGEIMWIDGLKIQILGVRNPEIHRDALNNSSMVFKISGKKSILFLGDLGPEGGRKLLASPYGKLVHADYVQMAHHGQRGVDEDFYKAVAPTCCLWPTPRMLWDNNAGKGPNTGPWTTLETRKWMEDLGVKRDIVSMNGLARIRE